MISRQWAAFFKRRRPLAMLAATALAAVLAAGCGSSNNSSTSSATSGSSASTTAKQSGPIFVGLATAKTGFLGTYDTEQTRAFLLRVKELNAAGGVDGRKIKTKWVDTKTDLAGSALAAKQLLADGAQVLMVSCDFDYGSPAAIEAARKNVVAMSSCAADTKFADKKTIGPTAFTMATGADAQGAAGAEWGFKKKGWKSAYVFVNQALEYNKTDAKYFKAELEALGGKVVGTATYQGTDNINVDAQVTRLKSELPKVDHIAIMDILPTGASVLRAIRGAGIKLPVIHPGVSMYGPTLTKVAGPTTNFFTLPYGCVLDCSGDDNPAVAKFMADYSKAYGGPPASAAHPIIGYDLGSMMFAGIKAAGTTDGTALVSALEKLPAQKLLAGDTKFTDKCHMPVGRPLDVVEYTGTKAKFLEKFAASSIPENVDPNNPCAAEQAKQAG